MALVQRGLRQVASGAIRLGRCVAGTYGVSLRAAFWDIALHIASTPPAGRLQPRMVP
jgi:hypothetical protein